MRDELPAPARALSYFAQRPEERQPAARRVLQRQNLRLWTRQVETYIYIGVCTGICTATYLHM